MTKNSVKPTKEQIEILRNTIEKFNQYRSFLIYNRHFNNNNVKLDKMTDLLESLLIDYDLRVKKYSWKSIEEIRNTDILQDLRNRKNLCLNSLFFIKTLTNETSEFYELLTKN